MVESTLYARAREFLAMFANARFPEPPFYDPESTQRFDRNFLYNHMSFAYPLGIPEALRSNEDYAGALAMLRREFAEPDPLVCSVQDLEHRLRDYNPTGQGARKVDLRELTPAQGMKVAQLIHMLRVTYKQPEDKVARTVREHPRFYDTVAAVFLHYDAGICHEEEMEAREARKDRAARIRELHERIQHAKNGPLSIH